MFVDHGPLQRAGGVTPKASVHSPSKITVTVTGVNHGIFQAVGLLCMHLYSPEYGKRNEGNYVFILRQYLSVFELT